uniref:Immunoglobulin V-set domain-containing protein n=1 Tax=Cynoglossus semilaevis TaxID=244447 RepID=A0A3P8UMB4_CYNSE
TLQSSVHLSFLVLFSLHHDLMSDVIRSETQLIYTCFLINTNSFLRSQTSCLWLRFFLTLENSVEHLDYKQLAGRASVFPHLVTRGNATLVLRRSGLKDRGTYRCHVHTSQEEHEAKVVLKVEGETLAGLKEKEGSVHSFFPSDHDSVSLKVRRPW